jgi:acetyl esterase/lipase
MTRKLWVLLSWGILLAGGTTATHAQDATTDSDAKSDSRNCYDPSDKTEMRLWEGRAPGATGDDPCRDIPFLKVYPATEGARPNRTAIIIMPGGGYDRLSDRDEQAPVADYFSRQLHVTSFVLFYRLATKDGGYGYPIPMWDAQRAIKLVRARAPEFGVDPGQTGIFGFSAGGHLASTIALHPETDFGLTEHDRIDWENARPDFLGMGYPVISMLPDQFASPNSLKHLLGAYKGDELDHLEHYLSGQDHVTFWMPPVFLFESLDDKQISSQNSVLFSQALKAQHVSSDVHLFAHGVHGDGLATGIPGEEEWPDMFQDWLARMGYVK